MVDECHATGFLGKTGKGTIEMKNVLGKVDIITGTLGKALGGAMGGFTSGKKEIIEILRQRSRPYLFSNSLIFNLWLSIRVSKRTFFSRASRIFR